MSAEVVKVSFGAANEGHGEGGIEKAQRKTERSSAVERAVQRGSFLALSRCWFAQNRRRLCGVRVEAEYFVVPHTPDQPEGVVRSPTYHTHALAQLEQTLPSITRCIHCYFAC